MLLWLANLGNAGGTASAPVFTGTIPDISLTEGAAGATYDLSTYFTSATSYSIAPAVEAGWTFNTSTGVLTVDPLVAGVYGGYVVTGTNGVGSTNSNSFTATVVAATSAGGSSDPPRKRKETKAQAEKRRKFYRELAEAKKPIQEGPPLNLAALKRPTLALKKQAPREVEALLPEGPPAAVPQRPRGTARISEALRPPPVALVREESLPPPLPTEILDKPSAEDQEAAQLKAQNMAVLLLLLD